MSIKKLREQINIVDKEILNSLLSRFKLVKKIKKIKKENKLEIEDKNREKEIIEDLANQANKEGISEELIKKIWKAIFAESKRKQQ